MKPREIACDGQVVRVEWISRATLPGRLGGDYKANRIRVAGQATPQQRLVAWHEVLHHAVERGGLDTTSGTVERVLDALDTYSLCILRENPGFVEWLTEADP